MATGGSGRERKVLVTQQQSGFRKNAAMSVVLLMAFMAVFGLVSIARPAAQEQAALREISPEQAEVMKWELAAAAAAFGLGAIGAGIAIANVGAAAMGAIGEKPEIASQALIFIALAEGLVVFGFITALMILGKV
jgi:V/A-type H+-transporting ATPase subunit K